MCRAAEHSAYREGSDSDTGGTALVDVGQDNNCTPGNPSDRLEDPTTDCNKDQEAGLENSSDDDEQPIREEQICDHDDLEEEFMIRDRKTTEIFVRRVHHSDTRNNGKKKATSRVQTNYHCCFICHELVSNFRKHIWTHKTHNDVQELPKLKSTESKDYIRK